MAIFAKTRGFYGGAASRSDFGCAIVTDNSSGLGVCLVDECRCTQHFGCA